MIWHFDNPPSALDIPVLFPSPFRNVPHSLAEKAARLLMQELHTSRPLSHDFAKADGGKMFGVLVVKTLDGKIGYIAGFSGMLGARWRVPGFVPPVFDESVRDEFFPRGEAELANIDRRIKNLQTDETFLELKKQLQNISQQSELELAVLREVLSMRKIIRRDKRKRAEVFNDNASLVELSFESQRDRRSRQDLQNLQLEKIRTVEKKIANVETQLSELGKKRQRISRQLQAQLFDGYCLSNSLGQTVPIRQFFPDKLPPGGSGDCAAPKLLAFAHLKKLRPIALAEFWWGASPRGGIRHHGHFYPSCRGKCGPILPFMLGGVNLESPPNFIESVADSEPRVILEDDDLLVVDKPAGMLSVPGKSVTDSVQIRLRERYSEVPELKLVHRLDMSTSGLLLVAKNLRSHKKLQAQFIRRCVQKRYVAVLAGLLETDQGEINLPLRTDFDDRPRQMVCEEFGKSALTRWQVISRTKATTRVYFYPHTGRTHQLRLHAAHPRGLQMPIEGDELYGDIAERLLLHAERLVFEHPVTGVTVIVESPVPF